MADLFVRPEAEDELDALYLEDPDAANLIEVLLEELGNDDRLLDILFRPANHFLHEPPFEIKPFFEAQKRGKNIFILKVKDHNGTPLNHRVLLAYHAAKEKYHVLSVANREIAYDTTDRLFTELLDRYQRADVPDYK